MLNEIIEVSSGFQTSVNISYDLKNDSKIQNFIPTMSSLDLIYNLLQGLNPDSTSRAKILSGAYGRGKSHIVLVALSVLYRHKDKKFFEKLLNKMKEYDADLYKTALNIIENENKLLPVIISGSSSSLTQSFMNALQQTLSSNEMEDIMPDTHFQAAVNSINKWKENYADTYQKFEESISCSVDNFIIELNKHNTEIYQEFINIYPELTAGSLFNPFVGFDVVEIYEQVSRAIKDRGYNGLYIVYDEFGKYLETSIVTATESDTKLLQDFAEKCTRSGKDQMHILLICHKDISNYIDMNLPQDKVDGWRGISARFEHINLHNNYSQMYEVIAAAIEKNKAWNSFYKAHSKAFDNLADRYSSNNLLGNKDNKDDVLETIKGCYPLHPSTTYILPRLSERVAQNERTLFTFLSADQKNTLVEFIEKNNDEFPLVTPDFLYDYFEMQFKKELNSSEIYKTYHLASTVLRKVEKGSLQSKVIKTIALIYMIEQFEKLPPTIDSIIDSLVDVVPDPKEITDAINELIDNACIVYLKRSNNYLKLKKSSGVNTEDQIRDRVEQLKLRTNLNDILNQVVNDSYLYPVRYNDENSITRYFEFYFTKFNEITDNYYFKDKDANGLIQAVFFENAEEFTKFNADDLKLKNEQTVIVVPKSFSDIYSSAYEYLAVTELQNECTDDEVLYDEYAIYLDDLEEIINGFISDYTNPEKRRSDYYHNNQKLNIFRRAQLSSVLSNICEKVYRYTPIINNESLNKNVLPTVAINSRTKVTTALLENSVIEDNLGLTGTGQDVSFMRSALMQTGILKEKDGIYTLDLSPTDDNMKNMLSVIMEFFRNTASKGMASFSDLYKSLTSAENGIGLKRGVIPIYIAVVLNSIKNDIVIHYKKNEVKITSDLLNNINEDPEHYTVVMENWDEDKSTYLSRLESIFTDHIVEKEKSYNGFTYIAMAMYRWYMSLPRCAKEMKRIYGSDEIVSKEYIKFLNTLKQPNDNNRTYLIEELPKIFKEKNVSGKLSDSIAAAKLLFDSSKAKLLSELIECTKKTFKANENASLSSAIKDWYESLKTETLQYQFVNNENKLISFASTVTNDENNIVTTLGKLIVGLRIDDWNEESVKKYNNGLTEFINVINEYNISDHSASENKNESCKISFIDGAGKEVVRVFEKKECSSRAKLLYNDITSAIEEMGQSISEHEKRQVLIEILEKMFQ